MNKVEIYRVLKETEEDFKVGSFVLAKMKIEYLKEQLAADPEVVAQSGRE